MSRGMTCLADSILPVDGPRMEQSAVSGRNQIFEQKKTMATKLCYALCRLFFVSFVIFCKKSSQLAKILPVSNTDETRINALRSNRLCSVYRLIRVTNDSNIRSLRKFPGTVNINPLS